MRLMCNWLDGYKLHEQERWQLNELDTQSTSDEIYTEAVSTALVFKNIAPDWQDWRLDMRRATCCDS